jgi:hypothetical protein
LDINLDQRRLHPAFIGHDGQMHAPNRLGTGLRTGMPLGPSGVEARMSPNSSGVEARMSPNSSGVEARMSPSSSGGGGDDT